MDAGGNAGADRAKRDEEIAKIQREFMVKPVLPSSPVAAKKESSSSSSSSSSNEEEEDDSDDEGELSPLLGLKSLPLAHVIKVHAKSISSLAWDSKCTRLASGALDGSVHLYDTSRGLSGTLKPFRTLPTTCAITGVSCDQSVVDLCFNMTSALLAVGRRDAQIRIFDRDGTSGGPKVTTTRGDVYIHDMMKTKGHVGQVSHIEFSMSKPHILLSSGEMDGTVRLWDVENGPRALMGTELACTHTFRYQAVSGRRNSVVSFCQLGQTLLVGGASSCQALVWDLHRLGALPVMKFSPQSDPLSLLAWKESMLLVGTKERMIECWDVKHVATRVWMSPRLDSPIKCLNVGPTPQLLLVTCLQHTVVLRLDTGAIVDSLQNENDMMFSSNVVFHGCKTMIRGTSEGSLAVFSDPALSVLSDPILLPGPIPPRAKSKDSYFARVDSAKVESVGEIMPAEQALAMVKGTKRSKHARDLRDDM